MRKQTKSNRNVGLKRKYTEKPVSILIESHLMQRNLTCNHSAVLESHFLQETGDLIVFRMNRLTHTHRVLFRTEVRSNVAVVFLITRASSGNAEILLFYISIPCQHERSDDELPCVCQRRYVKNYLLLVC